MKKKNKNLCEVKGCYGEYHTKYYNHKVCLKCLTKHFNGSFSLKKAFNIPEPTYDTFSQEKAIKPTLIPILHTLKDIQ